MANRFGDQELATVNRFGDTAGPPPPPVEASPIAKAGQAFFEGIGGQAALDIIRASNRYGTPQEVAARGERGTAAAKGLVQGIVNEPGRVRQEITNALDAFVAGNPRATLHHLLTAVPLVGAPIDQAAQEFNRGAYAEGVGHTAAIVAPLAHEPIGAGLTRAAEAGGALAEGAARTAKAATGAAIDVVGGIDPALREGIGVISPRAKHVLDVAARVKKARDAYTAAKATAPEAAPAAPAKTPGQVFAESQGYDWSNLSTKDQTTLEQVAQAQANVAAQPAPQTPPAAPPFQPRGLLPAAPNVIIPEAPPPPPDTSFVRAVPAQYPEVIPPTLRANTAAADLAGQLEASMRVETIADYLARNKIPNAMLESFGDNEWKMIADQAGVRAPSPENIQAIRGNLAEYEAAATQPAEVGKMAPAEAKADFEHRRATRAKRKPPAVAAEAAPAAPEAPGVPEPWRGTPPAEGGAVAPTASELRIEKLAQHLTAEKGISVESLAGLVEQPEALLQFEKLAKALGEARPAPTDIPQIIERVRQLRAQ